MPYKAEIIERKDPTVKLEASKLSITDLFSNLLNATKGFKYHITVKVLFKKYKHNEEIEFAPVYFNSVKKKYSDKSEIKIRKLFSRNFILDWCLD